jgi:hypothetical protein
MSNKKHIDLLNICYSYLFDVEKIVKKINNIFEVKSIWDLRGIYPPKFSFKKNNFDLIFHGSGVRILENENEILDIEYGCNIDVCGIASWKVLEYINSKDKYKSFFLNIDNKEKYLNDVFSDLLKIGKIKKIGNLFFINDINNRDKLKKYKHNNK